MKSPYLFDEFFASGQEESVSPFLTPGSRPWGKNLSLKSASSAALLLALAFSFSFLNAPVSYLCLSFVYFLVGVPALISSLNDLKNLEINIDVLMTLAAFVAVLLDSGMEGALLLVLFEGGSQYCNIQRQSKLNDVGDKQAPVHECCLHYSS